ncbi:hypothetical protein D3C81_2175830 [compost metagenome]
MKAFDAAEFLIHCNQQRRTRQSGCLPHDVDKVCRGFRALSSLAHGSAHVLVPCLAQQKGNATSAQITTDIVIQVQIPERGQ